MKGMFTSSSEVQRDQLDWGELGWLSRPKTTNGTASAVVEVTLNPRQGHDFHKHPNQEEVIYVVAGEIEQWIEGEQRTLKPGDSAFIEADTVHASFNTGDQPARLIVVLGPCVGEEGYELVDVSGEFPWNTLR
jgi:quercetin dioxygenase-like cupin family protein